MPSAKHKKKKDDAPASTSLSAFTDLLVAIELGDEGKVTRLLKQSKAIVDGPADAEWNTARNPVFKAIACQQVGCLRLLIDAGAEVNLVDRQGVSPLMEACKADDTARSAEMVRQLVFARAALDIQDDEGFTPLMRASLQGVHEGALPPPPPRRARHDRSSHQSSPSPLAPAVGLSLP